jgi:hypothetical protein
MNRTLRRAGLCAAVTAVLFAAPGAAPLASAQAPQTTTAPAAGAKAGTRTVAEIVRRMSEGAGFQVVADSNVAALTAPVPAEPTTPENVEKQIADLVQALGGGTTWARLHLPAPPAGTRGYKGDDVAALAAAQARIFGRVGDAPAGSVEVLGKTLAGEQATPIVSGLNLKPVYLIANPRAAAVQQNWAGMSEDQRSKYAQDQAARLARADDATRQGWMQEHMAVMGQLMRQLTPEQRNALCGGMAPGANVRVIMRGPDGTIQGGTPGGGNIIVTPVP